MLKCIMPTPSVEPARPPRWQLSRAGIVNVYQYEHETLEFRGGRLLLRGINGSGKSTAMNMLLPFLLTGRTRGIDAAGEQTGVLKSWMLSGRDEAQPVGYLWVEFAQVLEGGPVEHQVIGCGIKANRASETVATWWFATSRRPGIDLQLVEGGVPLGVDALRSDLGDDPVFAQDRRADYRREVAKRLYGGADNAAVLALLDTVRNPRVGDRVESDLPRYLADALPTLSEAALMEAARPLDDLDEHRRNVADLARTEGALEGIAEVYRGYALAELHRAREEANAVVRRSDRCARAEREARAAEAVAEEGAAAAARELAELGASVRRLDEEIRALQASEAYTEGRQLDDLRAAVRDGGVRLERIAAALAATDDELRRDAGDVERLEARTGGDLDALHELLAGIAASVEATGLAATLPAPPAVARETRDSGGHRIVVPASTRVADGHMEALRAAAGAALLRRGDVGTVRGLIDALDALARELRDARAERDRSEGRTVAAREALGAAREALEGANAAWDEAIARWSADVDGCFAVMPEDDAVATRWNALRAPEAVVERPARRSELAAFLEAWLDVLGTARLRAEAGVDEATGIERQARDALDALRARVEPELPRPDWQGADGLVLADAVDFAPDVDEGARAGLEAALEASGLLTARVDADGVRLGTGELVAVPGEAVASPLSASLVATMDGVMDEAPDAVRETVERLLASVSTDLASDAPTVISPTGDFRLAALRGRHAKPAAEHVGAGARRAALERQRALAAEALDAAAETLRVRRLGHDAAQAALEAARARRSALPVLDGVRDAAAQAAQADERLAEAVERARELAEVAAGIDRRHAGADDEVRRQARDLGLPAERAGLEAVDRALGELSRDARECEGAVTALQRSCTEWAGAGTRWAGTAERRDAQAEERAAEGAEHEGRAARLATLEATLGTAYHEVVKRIAEGEAARRLADERRPAAEGRRAHTLDAAARARAATAKAVGELETAGRECAAGRDRLVDTLEVPGLVDVVFVGAAGERAEDAGEIEDAGEVEGETTRADASAPAAAPGAALRAVASRAGTDRAGLAGLVGELARALPALPAERREVTADSVRSSMLARRDSLGAGWDAENRQPDPGLPMALSVSGPFGRMALAEALVDVRAQSRRMRSLLTTKQDQALRTLLHGQLAGDVARKLHQAQALVARMNERLSSVTTTHGIGVRLRWRRDPELDEATGRMVDVLQKLPDLRSDEEELLLRETLSAKLDEARRLSPEAPYRELIDAVLDYRAWHDMAVLLRRGEDAERKLSRRTPLSEGEKKLVTYLPLFAAVAASCDALAEAGGAAAPRFLLLDDAFAKVSEDNHAGLFGLLVDLDLDFIATSERLWGTHATVPALAITEVVRDDAAGVILLEHSRWDGARLTMSA